LCPAPRCTHVPRARGSFGNEPTELISSCYFFLYYLVVKMDEKERKYLHLRMLINDIKLKFSKINFLTAEAVRIKDKLEQIEIVNNDTELKIKEAIEREFWVELLFLFIIFVFILLYYYHLSLFIIFYLENKKKVENERGCWWGYPQDFSIRKGK
jgi:hypothetical protein